jgi:hypothetical protein
MINKKQRDVIFTEEKIRGIVDFARVHEPKAKFRKENSKFDNDKEYSVSIRMDNPETLKQFNAILKKYNFSSTVLNPNTGQEVPRVRPDKDGKMKVQVKRNYVTQDGKVNVIPVVMADGETALPPDRLVGNGSEAVVYLTISQNAHTKEGKSMLLSGLQVLKLSAPTGPKFENYEATSHSNDDQQESVF